MSIATNSVLRRILDEVRTAPDPDVPFDLVRNSGDQSIFEVRRTSAIERRPFSTSFHFWAHALRAFLADQGRADALEALAGNGLCESVEGERIAHVFDSLAETLAPATPIAENWGYRCGYKMIEQDVLVSWVAERPSEYVALIWARRSLFAQHPISLDT